MSYLLRRAGTAAGMAACLAVLTAVLVIAPAVAQAQTLPKAEALNEEGKALYKNKDYAGAATKFRAAIALSPEARFYFNLCATLEKNGDYDGAIEACDAVYTHAPTDELKGKTGQRAAEIRAKKRKWEQEQAAKGGGGGGGDTYGGGGGDMYGGGGGGGTYGGGDGGDGGGGGGGGGGDTGGGGGGGMTGGGGPPPEEQIEETVEPGLNYKWAFGAELGWIANSSIGHDYQFRKNGGTVKLNADYLLWPKAKLGAQGYIHIGTIGTEDPLSGQLSVVDFGVGLYKHFKLGKSLYLSPLVGAHLTGITPSTDSTTTFATAGVRFEIGLDWVLSENHVISIVPLGVSAYLPAGDASDGTDPEFYGFDTGGAVVSISIGYNYRSAKAIPGVVALE